MFIKNIKYLISIFISIYLFNKISNEIFINFDELKILKDKIYLLIIIIIIFFPVFYFLSSKLIYLLNHLKKINLYDSFNATIIAYSYNLFLPAKSGDFLRYKYLDLKISFKDFFNINLIEKSISLFVLLVIIYVSYLFSNFEFETFFEIKKIQIHLSFFLICLLSAFLINILIKKDNDLKLKIKNLFFFDLLIWSFQFFQIYLIVKLVHLDISIFDTILIFGISIVAGLIPISIGGFGVRDYVIFLLFSNLKIDGNLFIILLLFNLRYILPIMISFFFSILNFYNKDK